MIDDLLLHDYTKQQLLQLLADIPHGLLLIGTSGAGKVAIAHAIAASCLGKSSVEALLKDPYVTVIKPTGSSIGIDAIRELQKFMSLKTTGTHAVRRVAIVQDAQSMGIEAQNAFLKLLEEPPADTVIILTVDHQQHLLPTVNSRLQAVQILPPNNDQVRQYFSDKSTPAVIDRAYLVSGGRVGLMSAILAQDTEHPLVAQIERAKQVYGQKVFERLCSVDELSKQKDELPGLLAALKRIARLALEQAAHKGQAKAVEQWHRRLDSLQRAEEALQKNANAKLLLTDLFLSL
jgi:hypothetical protein